MDQLAGWKLPSLANRLAERGTGGGDAQRTAIEDQLQQQLRQQRAAYLLQPQQQQEYDHLQRQQKHTHQQQLHMLRQQQQQHLQRQQELLQKQRQQQEDMHASYQRQHQELGLWPPIIATSRQYQYEAPSRMQQPTPPIAVPLPGEPPRQSQEPYMLPQRQQQQSSAQAPQQLQQGLSHSPAQRAEYPWLSLGREAAAGATASGYTKTAFGITQWNHDSTLPDLVADTEGSGNFSSIHSDSIPMDVDQPGALFRHSIAPSTIQPNELWSL